MAAHQRQVLDVIEILATCQGERDECRRNARLLSMQLREARANEVVLRHELERRWPWWVWLGIGAALGAGGLGGLLLF